MIPVAVSEHLKLRRWIFFVSSKPTTRFVDPELRTWRLSFAPLILLDKLNSTFNKLLLIGVEHFTDLNLFINELVLLEIL